MAGIPSLAAHLAPDTIQRLEQAAERRYVEGECLRQQNRLLAAVYFYGYSVEMCLAAAYFRSARFGTTHPIDDATRRQKMNLARETRHLDGKPLMTSDPHPLVGWARLLEWNRSLCGSLTMPERERLQEAVRKAKLVYKHWRPELRYKVTNVSTKQLHEVRLCVNWFIKQRGCL